MGVSPCFFWGGASARLLRVCEPNLVLTAHVPYSKTNVLVLDCLDVEANGGNRRHHLAQLELVDCHGSRRAELASPSRAKETARTNRSLASRIQTDHQDPHLFLSLHTAQNALAPHEMATSTLYIIRGHAAAAARRACGRARQHRVTSHCAFRATTTQARARLAPPKTKPRPGQWVMHEAPPAALGGGAKKVTYKEVFEHLSEHAAHGCEGRAARGARTTKVKKVAARARRIGVLPANTSHRPLTLRLVDNAAWPSPCSIAARSAKCCAFRA